VDPVVTPLAAAAGTALIGAITEDSWQQVKDAVIGLWRRVHPQRAETLGTELDALREDMLQARHDEDTDFERSLETAWQARLQRLLRQNPALATELQRILDTVLTPALPQPEQARIQTIITGTASGNAHLNQAGRDVNLVHGDQYNASRDIHTPRHP
jgi:hypothetical protein